MSEDSHHSPAAVAVTAGSIDPRYNQPYVDVSEDRTDPAPHRYVHGGFTGTDARFSLYFPPADRYQGRFFHNTYPLAFSEDVGPFPIPFDVATGDIGFTLDSGAYYVQTNLGGADRMDPGDATIAAYRVNAAAAKYSREVATELYGDHRPYGYLFGGSGGAYQVIGAAENTSGVWDGFVPFVIGTPNAIPSMFTVRMHALRVLRQRDRLPGVLDAIEPGGSGDPYADLNDEESAALREASLLGYPMRGWWNHESLTSGYFAFIAPLVPTLDPTYVEDFWTKPGYLGTDPTSSIGASRAQFDTVVATVVDGFPTELQLADVPDWDITDAHLVITSGASAGKSIPIATVDDRTVGFTLSIDFTALGGVQTGDQVRIDNSWVLALQTYQRHQVPTPDLYAWDQFRGPDGTPIYPQRDILIGAVGAKDTAGSVINGRINGKVLALEVLMDIDALAWQADWYRSAVRRALGSRADEEFALWFIDRAQHDNPATIEAHAHAVSYGGALQQALRDLSAWVEKGIRPSETVYDVVDTQIRVPATAAERRGVQAVIDLRAGGAERADVAVGEPVRFDATIEVPPGAGSVVAAEWDFTGLGTFPDAASLDRPQPLVRLSATHAYREPGTFFAVLRVTSQREGDQLTPYGRVQNLARVRVVVT